MARTRLMYLFIGGTTAVGGASGSWMTAKIAASYGRHLGAWGVIAGAVIGAVGGVALYNMIREDSE